MKQLNSRRAKALSISQKVKRAVAERDEIDGYPCCIFCHNNRALPEAHFIPRSKGGLGIEENILTVCRPCHNLLDNGDRETRDRMKEVARDYLKSKYNDWKEEKLYYEP